MNRFKHFLIVLLCAVAFTLILFPKTLIGYHPVPGDLLVSFYFPWYSGNWPGYEPTTTHKEFLASDAIRQMIPWRKLAIDQFKQGQWPLWNPYNFAGTPLLANLQSAVFYPLNILFFILPFLNAWSLYILLQPILLFIFTYYFCRELKLSPIASAFGAIIFPTSSYFIVWFELGIIGHTIAWLPLILLGILKFTKSHRLSHFSIILIASAFAVFAGHIQTLTNVFLVSLLFWIYQIYQPLTKKKDFRIILPVVFWLLFSVGIMGIQLLPALELHRLSPMSEPFAREVFTDLKTPWQNLLTLLAPDYFGHPVRRNFLSSNYGDGTPFFGLAALIFVIYSFTYKQKRNIKFFLLLTIGYLLYCLPGPLFYLADFLSIPIFSQTLSSRSFFVIIFSLSILAANGLNLLIQRKSSLTKINKIILLIFISILFLTVSNFLSSKTNLPFLSDPISANIHFRNLVIPLGFITLLAFGLLITSYKRLSTNKFVTLFFVVQLTFAAYQINKTTPFSPSDFFYPNHLTIDQLHETTRPNRFLGIETAEFGTNFETYYRLYSPRGYDSLRILRYAQLVAGQIDGKFPTKYSKADADFIGKDSANSRRILDLLSTKYFIDKNDIDTEWNPDPLRFHNQADLIWQEDVYKIYQRDSALPRTYLTNSYQHLTDDHTIIATLYAPDFDYQNQLILEEALPSDLPTPTENLGSATITNYSPNQVTISAYASQPSLLTLTDAHFPGWQAYIDNQPTKIYRSNYALRSILLPEGNHTVTFSYHPKSFQYGLVLSLLTFFATIFSIFILVKSKKLPW